jgi:NAD(P)-dependent dehydrogenase (short-subunit alcohol dehydrogenase family)
MSQVLEKFSLRGQAAVVTGGAGLLGVEFCRTLAQAGAGVIVADLNGDAAEKTAEALKAEGLLAVPCTVDVTRADSTEAMVQAAVRSFGRLDVIVNSAAMDPKFDASQAGSHGNTFEDYPLEMWKQALDVNLTGVFLCCQAAARQMAAQGGKGSIINICSTYGLVPPDQRIYEKPGQPKQYKPAFYTTTKAGVLGLTKYIATYYAGTKIRANCLTPGGVYNKHDETFTRNYSYRTIMGRMAERDEMNGALLFLASEASSYMTGGNVVVDGGWTVW